MTCREEHFTRENHAPILRLQHRLRTIAHDYLHLRIAHLRRLAHERHATNLTIRRKVEAWKCDCRVVKNQIKAMIAKYHQDPKFVTVQDWDAVFEGRERKVMAVLGKQRLSKWPVGVPRWNMIALYEMRRRRDVEVEKRRERNEQLLKSRERIRQAREAQEEQAEKCPEREAISIHREARVSHDAVIYRTTPTIEAQIRRFAFQNRQTEKQYECLRWSRVAPWLVSFEQWCDACRGTDVLQKDRRISRYFELARRRHTGEKYHGDVLGQ
jgi:hypothetical protein